MGGGWGNRQGELSRSARTARIEMLGSILAAQVQLQVAVRKDRED